MYKIITLVIFLFLVGCKPQVSYSYTSGDMDEGGNLRRDGYTMFRWAIYYNHQYKKKKNKLLPTDVKIVINDSEYSMKFFRQSNNESDNEFYVFFIRFPESKFQEGTKYHFVYKINGQQFQSSLYTLKYEK